MNRLEARMVKLEAAGRCGWRAFVGRPVEQWPDEALLGLLGESQGWPPDHEPTDAELEAIAAGSARGSPASYSRIAARSSRRRARPPHLPDRSPGRRRRPRDQYLPILAPALLLEGAWPLFVNCGFRIFQGNVFTLCDAAGRGFFISIERINRLLRNPSA